MSINGIGNSIRNSYLVSAGLTKTERSGSVAQSIKGVTVDLSGQAASVTNAEATSPQDPDSASVNTFKALTH